MGLIFQTKEICLLLHKAYGTVLHWKPLVNIGIGTGNV